MIANMEKPFVYGVAVTGGNFTDRKKETKRLKMNFEAGINTVLISPRRMGKTSIVTKVRSLIDNPKIRVVMMDIYDCRSEFDFYERFATAIVREVAGKMENVISDVRDFLGRFSAKISVSPDPSMDYSISLGISPKELDINEVLELPEKIAKQKGIHIVVCIDEFQQIGEFTDTITVQKKLRGVWQHQNNVSYCLFGSKKHLMEKIFQKKNMPFYQFGDMVFLEKIPTEEWVEYICSRFHQRNMRITEEQARQICQLVDNHSSYVQQLAWNVMIEADEVVTDVDINAAFEELLRQSSSLFTEQIASLTSYQMNFLRAVVDGVNSGYMSEAVLAKYSLGTKSNISRIIKTLTDKELIEKDGNTVRMSDPVFFQWFKRECKK